MVQKMFKPFLGFVVCLFTFACQPGNQQESTSAQTTDLVSTTPATELPYPQTPDEAIARLKEGNARFLNDQSAHPNRDDNRKIIQAQKQTPFASIMGCSDSRVPAEIVFDQGLGDLFIVRTAGQAPAIASFGSLEFSVAVLGVKVIVVMGHEKCGAVAGAIGTEKLPGHIEDLVNIIRPGVHAFIGKPDQLEAASKANVLAEVESLKKLDPILSQYIKEGKIKIIPAYYHLETGQVEFL
ncbi:carbonic anhydrase [Haliscomenobacter hydrossis]|uniref:carbonic anhydrase n=1 Tax=Haliscomenobacter hydrossis (strain ATCC 27775 / DSM 1100 / LMG 10767 / O) TaxID=760192 RepID=F4L6E0_HALH1|nr:carbonic anhydrase [Haliscomenobacter hydrossis]AEE48822.1 carbonic anhydrase [Haliscomenobacter hydrossis DSM 1100]